VAEPKHETHVTATGVTRGTGTAYPSGVSEFTPEFLLLDL